MLSRFGTTRPWFLTLLDWFGFATLMQDAHNRRMLFSRGALPFALLKFGTPVDAVLLSPGIEDSGQVKFEKHYRNESNTNNCAFEEIPANREYREQNNLYVHRSITSQSDCVELPGHCYRANWI